MSITEWLALTPLIGVLGIINLLFGARGISIGNDFDKYWLGHFLQVISGLVLIIYWANRP